MESLMKPTIVTTLLVLALAPACGDNFKPAGGTNQQTPDAGVSGIATAVIVAGDFDVTGVVSAMRVPQGIIKTNAVAGVAGGDPFLRHFGDEVFVINRASGDNITILDRALGLVQQVSTGAGVNPQDVAPVGRKLYVPGLATKGVVVLDRDHPNARGLIDLSSLDPDGKPDCVSVAAVGDRVFAVCGLLDEHYQPRGNAKVAVIDTVADKLVASFELAGKNPVGYLVPVPGLGGDLVIGTAPSFNDFSTGCLARIATTGTPKANGCAISNQAIGGIANHYEVSPDGKTLWIDSTAYDADFNLSGKIVVLDLASGALWPTAMTPSTMIATDLAACPNGYAVVIDGTFGAAGARVFRPDGFEVTLGAVDIGRAPGFGNNVVCY
jgi:hypothetical protein